MRPERKRYTGYVSNHEMEVREVIMTGKYANWQIAQMFDLTNEQVTQIVYKTRALTQFMQRGRVLTEVELRRIIKFRRRGNSFKQIAKKFNLHIDYVERLNKKHGWIWGFVCRMCRKQINLTSKIYVKRKFCESCRQKRHVKYFRKYRRKRLKTDQEFKARVYASTAAYQKRVRLLKRGNSSTI